MTRYEYKANDSSGKSRRGVITAENLDDFQSKMRAQGLFCTEVQECANQNAPVEVFAPKAGGKKLKLQEVAIFCRQFATMLTSGITVVKCLDILYHQAEGKALKKSLLSLYEEIKKGNGLSVAMREQGQTFPPLLINMIQSGEASGKLDDVMMSMSVHFEKERALKGKIKTAMIYPIVLISVAIIVIGVLMVFVVPTFAQLFGSAENLPGTTRFLLGLSDFMIKYWYIAVIIVVGLAVLFVVVKKKPSVKILIDRMLVKLPKIGKLMMVILTARFSRTISTLYASGMPIIDSIRISSSVLGNLFIASKIEVAIDDIKKGVTLSQSLISTEVFPTMFTSMVFIGEESGTLDSILVKTADFYDEDSAEAIAKMVALMEPMLILVMGVIVAFIVVSVAQPMFGMYDYIA